MGSHWESWQLPADGARDVLVPVSAFGQGVCVGSSVRSQESSLGIPVPQCSPGRDLPQVGEMGENWGDGAASEPFGEENIPSPQMNNEHPSNEVQLACW